MNRILTERPIFADDHFIFSMPSWLETFYFGFALLLAGFLAYLALTLDSISAPLTIALWLASGILGLFSLYRRSKKLPPHFACDHQGLYFPTYKAPLTISSRKEDQWLYIPWHNISDIKVHLLFDESATTKGVVFSVVATELERREFLGRHAILHASRASESNASKTFLVGFSSLFHRNHEVVYLLSRFRSAALNSSKGN